MFGLFEKPPAVGDAAPDFETVDHHGRPFRLSAHRGQPLLLVFYPGDDTLGCRMQLCDIRDSWGAFQQAGVAVYGVNPQSAESHQRFAGKHGFPFPLLLDPGQKIAKLYHSAGWIVKRTVLLIDGEGIIRFSQRGMPSPRTVLAALSRAPHALHREMLSR